MAPSGQVSVQMGQNTHAPKSIVSGLAEIAPVGQASTQATHPSTQREESIFGLPRKRVGVEADATSRMTGCPCAALTFSAFGHHAFMRWTNLAAGRQFYFCIDSGTGSQIGKTRIVNRTKNAPGLHRLLVVRGLLCTSLSSS